MSDKPDKESQTEEATDKRLHDSIEKGDIPNSREVALFASLLASLLFFVFFLRDGAARLIVALQQMVGLSGQYQLGEGRNATALIAALIEAAGAFVLPAFVLFIVSALVASFAQNPPSFVVDRIVPKLDRVSPSAGWSRIASSRGVTEFGKSLLKLLIVGSIAFFIVKKEIASSYATSFRTPPALPTICSPSR